MSSFGKKSFINRFCILILSIALALPVHVMGADAVVSQSLSFGTIDLNPGGDTITISASTGPASPLANSNSVITGGRHGLITVTSLVIEHVDIIYPVSVNMVSGSNVIKIISIDVNSQYRAGGADTLGGGIPLTIRVGGKIVIPPGQANGSYSAQIPIILNYS